MKARTLALIVAAAFLAGPVLAQEEPAAPSFDELQAMIARMQQQVEAIGQAAAERDKALGFLTEQVDKAAGQIGGVGQTNEALRGQAAALSDELEGARTERDRIAQEAQARADRLSTMEQQIAALEQSLGEERRGSGSLKEELDRTQARVLELSQALEATRRERESAGVSLGQAHEQVAALESGVASLRSERDGLVAELERTRAQLAAAQRDLEAERTGRGEATIELTTARSQLASLELSLEEERSARQAASSELTSAQARLVSLEQELTAARTESREELGRLRGQLTTLRGTIEALTGQLVAAADAGRQQASRIADLDRMLKEALAAKVEELSQYRSEFFGRLRQVLGDRPDIRIVGDRFVFQSELLFASGSATLDPAGAATLRDLARSLREVAESIPPDIDWVLRVDGHTDRLPIRAGLFVTNWELSAARAISVVEFLVREGIPPERLAAAGFGEFRPLDPRDDEIAYRRNRRIEFKLTEG